MIENVCETRVVSGTVDIDMMQNLLIVKVLLVKQPEATTKCKASQKVKTFLTFAFTPMQTIIFNINFKSVQSWHVCKLINTLKIFSF